MYTFYKTEGGTVISHTDGVMYATTDGAEIKYDGNCFKIDMDANSISVTSKEIESIGGETSFTDNKHIIESLLKVFG